MYKQFLSTCIIVMALFGILFISYALANSSNQIKDKIHKTPFNEGVVYSRTSFPGHPLNDGFKLLDFEKTNLSDQDNLIQDLKKHQQSIKRVNEQAHKDAFFVTAMVLMPAYSQMLFTPSKAVIKTEALGYHQQTLINNADNQSKLVLSDRNKKNKGTVKFQTGDINEVWQKHIINPSRYNIENANETEVVARYLCNKKIYTLNSATSREVSIMIINLVPERVTVWYTDEVDPSINLMHSLYFEHDKAILKYEVEYDTNSKNKMLVEVIKIEPQKIGNGKFTIQDTAPIIEHKKGSTQGIMMIMQVMMNAMSLLEK